MKSGVGNRLNWLLTVLTTVLLLASLAGLTLHFETVFRPILQPEMEKKAETVGSYVLAQIRRAVDYGIPVNRLVGVDDVLHDAIVENPDIAYLAVTDAGGHVLYLSGPARVAKDQPFQADPKRTEPAVVMGGQYSDTPLALSRDGAVNAVLHVGMKASFVADAMNSVFFDLASILVVAVLLNFEILILVIGTAFSAPMRQIGEAMRGVASGDLSVRLAVKGQDEVSRVARAINRTLVDLAAEYVRATQVAGGAVLGRLAGQFGRTHLAQSSSARNVTILRFALFVFALAEEVTRTFLSIYIKDLFTPVPWLPADVVIAAPIGLFMLLWAIAQPIAGSLSERRGRRFVFLLGAILSAVGLAGSGLVHSIVALMAVRSLAAIGYACVFISAQGMVIDNTDPRERAQAMALYAGGILTAGVCGPAIGGIIADQIGFRATFGVAASLAALAAALIYFAIRDTRPPAVIADRRSPLSPRNIGVVLRNPRFLGVALFSAVPTKLGLTALLFFLLPLYLDAHGVNQAVIGRVLLLYYLLMIIVSPLAARYSDRLGRRHLFLGAGGLLATVAAVLVSFGSSLTMVVAGVIVLGIAHAMVGAPQLAMLTEVCGDERARLGETTVIGIFRLIERCGSVIAPLLAGLLMARFGYQGAVQGISFVLAGCVVFFFLAQAIGARAIPVKTR